MPSARARSPDRALSRPPRRRSRAAPPRSRRRARRSGRAARARRSSSRSGPSRLRSVGNQPEPKLIASSVRWNAARSSAGPPTSRSGSSGAGAGGSAAAYAGIASSAMRTCARPRRDPRARLADLVDERHARMVPLPSRSTGAISSEDQVTLPSRAARRRFGGDGSVRARFRGALCRDAHVMLVDRFAGAFGDRAPGGISRCAEWSIASDHRARPAALTPVARATSVAEHRRGSDRLLAGTASVYAEVTRSRPRGHYEDRVGAAALDIGLRAGPAPRGTLVFFRPDPTNRGTATSALARPRPLISALARGPRARSRRAATGPRSTSAGRPRRKAGWRPPRGRAASA